MSWHYLPGEEEGSSVESWIARLRGERLKVLGNAQVPACAALAWERLTDRMEE